MNYGRTAGDSGKLREEFLGLNSLLKKTASFRYRCPHSTEHVHQSQVEALGHHRVRYPDEVWEFDYQESPEELLVHSDSDCATDVETRKSMTCNRECMGEHHLRRETVPVLSSGEAEFYAMVGGEANGSQTQKMLERRGLKLELAILSDSSAAREI